MEHLHSSQITLSIARPIPTDLLLINRGMKITTAFHEPGLVDAGIGMSVRYHVMPVNTNNLIQ
jgi:hypothetical protein